MPFRAARPVPADGRGWHGFAPAEFLPYDDADGRADPQACPHPIFLDLALMVTVLCMECGREVEVGTWAVADPARPVSLPGGGSYVPEGRLLTDDELLEQRHRWHSVWGLDGWTVTGIDLHPVPPLRLRLRYQTRLPTVPVPAGQFRPRPGGPPGP
jgi:hypothetical protein